MEPKKFRKEIIRVGRYADPVIPGKFWDFTLERFQKMIDATKASGLKTWVPYGHSKDARDNAGWIEGFEIADGKLYGVLNITDDETASKIKDGTIQDVSIGMGPVLGADGTVYEDVIKQVGLVMEPHVKISEGFTAAFEAAGGGFYFSASDRVNENLIRQFINLFKSPKEEGGDNLDEELKTRHAKMEVEFEAAKEKGVEMEARLNELQTKFEAADEKLKEAEGKIAEFEAADTERKDDEIRAFEAEATSFAEGLVKKVEPDMKEGAEPAKVERWKKLYLKDKELALETADSLGLKFEAGEVTGDPQNRPAPKASDKDPLVAAELKRLGYEDDVLERHAAKEEGEE